MKLIHLSTKTDCFGVSEVAVQVDDKKEYIYSLKSQYDIDVFLEQLRFHPGKALNYLKRVSIKAEK
jgi:hypothetical protein